MIKGIKKAALVALVLAGCHSNKSGVEVEGFDSGAYCYLVEEFREKGFYSGQIPLFDLSDEEVRKVYETNKDLQIRFIERDVRGAEEIKKGVEEHFKSYRNRNLVLISGAGVHIYKAVEELESSFAGDYISITPLKLGIQDVIESNKIFRHAPYIEEEKARETVKIQIRRVKGVILGAGYESLEDFIEKISDFNHSDNLFLGIEETGLHNLYYPEMHKVYKVLENFIEIYEPRSILYLRESNYFQEDKSRSDFLRKAGKLRIPVEIKGF